MNKILILPLFAFFLIFNGCTSPATRSFNKGKAKFDQAEYQPAIENFRQALAKGAPAGPSNYYIAESFRRSNRIQEAEPHYKAAVEAKTTEEDAYFWYAYALKSTGNYEAAENQFEDYLKLGTNFDYINRAKNELENLKVLNEIVNKKNFYEIKNMEDLNSPEAEYSPVIFDSKLYFTTSRGAEKMHMATGTGFTEIYEYVFDGVTKTSGQAKRLPDLINTIDAHEATPTFSKDGNTLIFSRGNNGSKKGAQDVDIYMTTKVNGAWTEPVMLPISDPNAWDSSPWLTENGKTLFFSSNREGGNGGTDIYKATLDASGVWGNVTNVGTPINTRGNEQFPYLSKDGRFFFSSDGHPSLGALDVFTVVKDEKGQFKIENIGQPVNTSYDDFGIFFVDSLNGYVSSNRPGGKGDDDIYTFFNNIVYNVHYYLDGLTLYQDKITYPQEHILSNATVKIVNEQGDTVTTLVTDSLGKFRYEVKPEVNYKLFASKEGYATEEIHFSTVGKTIPKSKLKPGENELVMNVKIVLPKKEKGITLVIDNIYYDFDKADIRPDAEIELFKIVEFMTNNTDIKVELSSHTDARGSALYNRRLAQRRADSAVAYIIKKGIAKARITAKGYGEDKPLTITMPDSTQLIYTEAYINKLPTPEEQEDAHQKNRRTEITITGITDPNIKIKKKGEK
jgi:peptidoglycan-associated lipoprotein